ncbi:TonB-dependent receptor [Aurantiacibacter gangjinensis]|uniref:Membrane protein n=1 Tax=Aurantiacibacter gangjinensis TaxID=502682 RepID=A0A0G9MRI5_9SPHN|nr:TonB-dependent receptor [Aurantiacibacter gangjinensis]APE26871.1 Oar-like outer membrane protein, OmpA family [Aurantiacibacter gangjinensis]KLE33342.1 membrane protein [Aurantiacibacter gangjinensis]
MQIRYLLAASVASLATAAMLPQAAQAQQITSGIQGNVTDTNGNAVSGASVTVTDTRTDSVRTTDVDSDGSFRVENLPSGGPYTVTVTAPGFEGQSVENQFITISGNTAYTFELAGGATAGSENFIVVTAARANVQQLAVGPGLAFGADTLEDFPSITRDIRDVIRIDPRVSLDRDNEVDRISCLGGNDRGNTFTVDGIVQADVFGLNGTPFAARNALPLPFDVIGETSVEFAPFDVEYSDFTGCLVNVVTKSGSNRFTGTAFFNYRDSGMRGDSIAGDDFSVDEFEELRWGATLGGPIIPDRLFFYAGYEETDLGDANDFGPIGSNLPNEADFVDLDQFNRFSQIARDVYGQETGPYPSTLAEASVRYFGRLDAYITDDHRLEATYQRLEETNVESDFGGSNLTGLNSFEDEGTISNYYSLRYFGQWSDVISTEIRLSRAEVDDQQGPVGGGEAQSDNPIPRLVVGVSQPAFDEDGNPLFDDNGARIFDNGVLSTGPGISRSANQLNTRIDQARFQVNLNLDDHQVKLGAEVNDLEVFNLFAINATGSLYFSNLDDFEAGILSQGFEFFPNADEVVEGEAYGADINAAPGGDINNAAAAFGRRIWSIYAQDEWQATDLLNLTAGVRVQFYEGDAPRENPNFIDRYGFSNAFSFSDLDPLILPRLAATYELDNEGFFSNTSITGGVGRFAGGDPIVYFSNAFSNNGFSTGLGTSVFCDTRPTDVVQNGSFTGFPQCVIDSGAETAERGLADTQSTDPDFQIPSVWRANLGIATDVGTPGGFFSDWRMNLDYIYSRYVDTLNFVDLSQTPNILEGINGFTVDGRPILAAIDPTNPFCNATLVGTGGTPPTYENVSSACFRLEDAAGDPILDRRDRVQFVGRDDEIQLTNGPSYNSHTASILLSKRFDGGVFTPGGSTFVRFGYAWTDSSNNRNVGSSTATSSFDRSAAFDRQNPAISTSNYETRHNFTAAVSLREEFFEDYATRLGVFFAARAGRPYSLTFDGGGVFADSSSGNDNALLYIPTGLDDPNLSPLSDPAAVDSLLSYLRFGDGAETCDFTPGETIRRNTCENNWYFDMDFRLSQELPFLASLAGIAEDRVELFVDFDNFLNAIDDRANVFRRRGGGDQTVPLVRGRVDDQGRYIIDRFNPDDENFVSSSASIWKIQFGVRYEF